MHETKTPAVTGASDALTASVLYNNSEPAPSSEPCDTDTGTTPFATLPAPIQEVQTEAPSDETETLRDAVIKMALEAGCDLFHDRNASTYVSVPINGHRETWRLRSEGFKRWLRYEWLCQTKHGVGPSVISDVLDTLDAKASFSDAELSVNIRIAPHETGIYVDLCDDQWRAVHITAHGWNITNDPPVKFIRTKGMLPLPEPSSTGNIDDLRPLINAPSDDVWCLIVAWILTAYSAGPFPILVLLGEQGSSKSFLARVIRQLIDPSEVETTTAPKDARDVIMAAQNSHVVALDNLSGIPGWLSDLLCGIATGAAHRERKYHTNNGEEELFKAKRPISLNGIDLAMRDDALSRSFMVTLPVIGDDDRRDEADLWQEIHKAAPSILGGIFDILSSILKHLPTTKLASKPRMADAALWVTAAESALGWTPGQFMEIYGGNRDQSAELALESDSFGLAIRDFMGEKSQSQWIVGWQDLLSALCPSQSPAGWPKSGKAVSNRLMRLAPALRHVGIRWSHYRDSLGKRYYLIEMDMSKLPKVAAPDRD